MTARCKVCKRMLTNPEHIAAGIGPVCAAKAAARASMTDGALARRAYPMERYEMIVRAAERLVAYVAQANRELAIARGDERAQARRRYEMAQHWYERVRRMEQRAYRLIVG